MDIDLDSLDLDERANTPKYKSLEHVSTVVVATNEHELAYIRSWCKQAGKGDPYLGDVESFPFCVSVAGELAGWTDRMDRALYYKPFSEFLSDIDELALAEADQRREQKLAEDEQPIEADNGCGGACTI